MQRVVTVVVPIPASGITNDPRDTRASMCRVCTNFDIVTDRARAIPYYDSEAGDTAASTSQKQAFTYAHWLPGSTNDWRLFSLGVVSGSGKAEILMKTAFTDGSWSAPANNASSAGTTSFEMFVFYKTTGIIYGAKALGGSSSFWGFDAKTAGAFSEDIVSSETAASQVSPTTMLNVAQGIVHSQDDILYLPYDNKIATNNNKTWTLAALTLPADLYITSICEYGTFLAIACAPLGVGKSRVYLWDRNSSLTTISANIDWGFGIIKVLEEIEGYLVGISLDATNRTSRYRVNFKYYAGAGGARQFAILTSTSTPVIPMRKQKINNRVHFLMSITLNGSSRDGLWSVTHFGGGQFALAHERTPNNDTALGAGVLKGFYVTGDYAFISYVDNASAYQLSKTNDQASYTATSIIETIINPNMPAGDKVQKKKLLSIGAMYDPLPSGGSCVVKSKTNGASSYTTVFTETTTSAVKTEPVPVPSGGTYLTDGEEFEFQINSTGGVVPTFLIYKYAVEESNT
jgi:hypothetical protein